MAIRMVDDPRDPNEYNDRGGGGRRPGSGGGGGGGGLFQLLPLLFMLIRKPGGWLILVLLAGGYFLLNGGGGGLFSESANSSSYATGGTLDPAQYAKAEVYEGLSEDDVRNPLPGFVSLGKFAPPRLNQGKQGSCVAWSAAYAAHTVLVSASNGVSPQQQAFSPAYMYNQIALSGCQGSYLERAMTTLSQKGSVPFNAFPYDENTCTRPIPNALDGVAAQNRIHGFNRLTGGDDVKGLSVRAIKEHLAKDAPVMIGMMVGGSFMEGMIGQKLWQPTERDYSQSGFGGHAMTVIGYDDKLAGGAFQIMNSWGPEWGENGIGWVRYADFVEFTREAYGIDPLPKKGAALNPPFDCEIGLVQVDELAKPAGYIPIKPAGANNTFSSSTLPKGTRFKMEVKNNTPCYVYVFGQEATGESYTLFPYPLPNDPSKTAYTPYCGITGVRLFPKDKSMMPDEVGNKDFMAVVVSTKPLDWFELNKKIDQGRGNYTAAVSNALSSFGNVGRIAVSGTGKGNMKFTAPGSENAIAWAVVEVNK